MAAETPDAVRLHKFLASAGVGSRRHCEELISEGKVSVDGETVTTLGYSVNPAKQKIEVNGIYLKPEPKRYYLINKPAGFICSNSDPAGRPLAVDLVTKEHFRLFTVGRLDENSTGLMLVTNDGSMANRLMHPRYRIVRTYVVQVAGRPTQETIDSLRKGLYFTEGLFKLDRIKAFRKKGQSTFLEVDIHEGKNREVRRLFARVGHKVMSLQRIRLGPLNLGRLGLGKFRPLTKTEFEALKALLDKKNGAEDDSAVSPSRRSPKGSAKKGTAKRKKTASVREKETGVRRGAQRGSLKSKPGQFKGKKKVSHKKSAGKSVVRGKKSTKKSTKKKAVKRQGRKK